MIRVLGVLVVTFGGALLAWLAYSLFVVSLPITQAPNPFLVVVSTLLLHVGCQWMRGRPAWESLSTPGATRERVGRILFLVCLSLILLGASGVLSPTAGWIGFGIGVLGNLIGWGKLLVTTDALLGTKSRKH